MGFVVGNAVLNEEDDGFIIVEDGRKEIMEALSKHYLVTHRMTERRIEELKLA